MRDDRLIDRAELGELEYLGDGGQGVVYRVPTRLYIPNVGATSYVYKEYQRKWLAVLDAAALHGSVDLLRTLPRTEADSLLSFAAWPVSVVLTKGTTTGFVMPEVRQGFYFTYTPPSGVSTTDLARFEYILDSRERLADANVEVVDADRLRLLRAVASALATLHRHDITVGDLSPRNLLFSLSGTPSCYFIDCDSMSIAGVSPLPPVETRFWKISELSSHESVATKESDSHKFGLLALRLLAGKQRSKNLEDLGKSVPDDLRGLIAQSLDATPAARPPVAAWLDPLSISLGENPVVGVDTTSDGVGVTAGQTQPAISWVPYEPTTWVPYQPGSDSNGPAPGPDPPFPNMSQPSLDADTQAANNSDATGPPKEEHRGAEEGDQKRDVPDLQLPPEPQLPPPDPPAHNAPSTRGFLSEEKSPPESLSDQLLGQMISPGPSPPQKMTSALEPDRRQSLATTLDNGPPNRPAVAPSRISLASPALLVAALEITAFLVAALALSHFMASAKTAALPPRTPEAIVSRLPSTGSPDQNALPTRKTATPVQPKTQAAPPVPLPTPQKQALPPEDSNPPPAQPQVVSLGMDDFTKACQTQYADPAATARVTPSDSEPPSYWIKCFDGDNKGGVYLDGYCNYIEPGSHSDNPKRYDHNQADQPWLSWMCVH